MPFSPHSRSLCLVVAASIPAMLGCHHPTGRPTAQPATAHAEAPAQHDAATATTASTADASASSPPAPTDTGDGGWAPSQTLFCGARDGRVPVSDWRAAIPHAAVVSVLASDDLDGDGRPDAVATVFLTCGSDPDQSAPDVSLVVAWNGTNGWTLEDLWPGALGSIEQDSGHAQLIQLAGERFLFVWASAGGAGGALDDDVFRIRPGHVIQRLDLDLDFDPFFTMTVAVDPGDVLRVESLEDQRSSPGQRPQQRWRRRNRFVWDAAHERFTPAPGETRRPHSE